MSDLSNGGGVALPQDLLIDIASTPAETPTPTPTASMLASAGPLPGGVSAMPIDAATFLQVVIPPVPSFAPAGTKISVTITARILAPDGTLSYCRWDNIFDVTVGMTFNSDLAPGYLLSVCATTTTAGVVDGAVYAILGLTHQSNPGVPLDTLLVSSYISTYVPVGWPNGILRTLSDGNGFAFGAVTGVPGAGVPVHYIIVDNYVEPIVMQASLTTSVSVGIRQVKCTMFNGTLPPVTIGICPNTQAQGTTVNYTFTLNLTPLGAAAAAVQYCTLGGPLILSQPFSLYMTAVNLDGGDQFTALTVFGRAWI
jgi:hypothetical protein